MLITLRAHPVTIGRATLTYEIVHVSFSSEMRFAMATGFIAAVLLRGVRSGCLDATRLSSSGGQRNDHAGCRMFDSDR